MVRLTGRSGEEVRSLRRDYINRYGTTLGGLMYHHDVDPDEYMDYVHAVPVEEMLQADVELSVFLRAIELPKIIFTNASSTHAARVLTALGVRSHFDSIFDLADTGYHGKPGMEAFRAAVARLGSDPGEVLFVDDIPVNVQAARKLGILTAHVAGDGHGVGDLSVETVTELRTVVVGAGWYRG